MALCKAYTFTRAENKLTKKTGEHKVQNFKVKQEVSETVQPKSLKYTNE